jgi:formate dehydrogenase beta subunit
MSERIDITKLINTDWLDKNFPCYTACPVHTEAGRYVALIAEGRYQEAYHLARRPNPFASLCGRICAAPCESACRRGQLDAPIAIRALKRFVCERYGVESMVDLSKLREVFGKSLKKLGIKVAIIGAGPAGLSCAHDLAMIGYDVTIFEAQSVAGGMLRLGVPEYRLPRELIRLEVNAILSLGVELKLNTAIGRDFTLSDLKKEGYQAVFIGIGAHRSRDLRVEGVELDGVLRAVDFLLNVNLGYRVDLGDRVIVVGGGNVAFDVARSAARQEKVEETHVTEVAEALDVARSAVRFGAREVHVVCLESPEEMPATKIEIDEAAEERIQIHNSKGPHRIVGENGKVVGLETIDCLSVFDEQGKFNPKFAQDTLKIMDADTVIMAIGQSSDLSFIKKEDGIDITARNTIKVDPNTLATSARGIFAGGDVSFGPRNAIDAIANGKRAAQSIDQYLQGTKHDNQRPVTITSLDSFDYQPLSRGYENIARQEIPTLPIDRRIGIAQVEIGYDELTARKEASRCLRCWINTTFEEFGEESGTECILCGGCADICPENCIEIIPFSKFDLSKEAENTLTDRYAIAKGMSGLVMIKDETVCIRCGLCAKRCPVGCITMEAYEEAS